jgi:excisionase family DNA binding protein
MNELLTLAEVQQILRIGRSKVYELAHRKDFPAIKIDRSIRVPRAALEQWLLNQRRSS